MVFTDWTIISGTVYLCGNTKYAGNSSTRMNEASCELQHDTFLEPQMQCILWTYINSSTGGTQQVNLSTYGNLCVRPSVTRTWEKFRTTFWYDAATNTKWGRIEKWVDSAWVQHGNDTNFGAGSPGAGTLSLKSSVIGFSTWFDELEVSA